jgi:hypothetical protein
MGNLAREGNEEDLLRQRNFNRKLLDEEKPFTGVLRQRAFGFRLTTTATCPKCV